MAEAADYNKERSAWIHLENLTWRVAPSGCNLVRKNTCFCRVQPVRAGVVIAHMALSLSLSLQCWPWRLQMLV